MLLGINILKKTKDEFLTDFATLASSPDTLIFIDTNILSHLFKLHSAARQDFFDWVTLAINDQRLYIPAWCAGEYLAKVKTRQLHTYTPTNKGDEQLKKSLEALLDTASLFIDETVLKSFAYPGTRNEYLTGFREAIDNLKKYTQAFKHQCDPDKIHAEIEEYLGKAVLDSPVSHLCERAAKEAPSRIEHRLPPGFRDEGKAENKLGDLIIWFEIMERSQEKKHFSNVLFLTNDEKSDWVYAPAKRLEQSRGSTRSIPNTNPTLKIIDPRLVSEFKHSTGHSNISICTLPTLVQGLSKTQPITVAQLAAAIQIELVASQKLKTDPENEAAAPEPSDLTNTSSSNEDIKTTTATITTNIETENSDSARDTIATFSEQNIATEANKTHELATAINLDGYRDSLYQTDAPGELNDVIESLRSHNWYTQNPAFEKLKAIAHENFPPTSWFVLGRNIYQAACGNAQKAMDFLSNLESRLNWFPQPNSDYILSGIVFEIYFDSHGNLRKSPKAGYLAKPLSLLAKGGHPDVCNFIKSKLTAAGAKLFFYPGDDKKYTVTIHSEPIESNDIFEAGDRRQLVSITVNECQILAKEQPDNIQWLTRYRVSYSAADILDDISTSLSIPRWALKLDLIPEASSDTRFVVPNDRWFSPTLLKENHTA